MPSRAQRIKELLDEHFMVAVGQAVATPTAEQWRTMMVDELGPQAMFGWSWPIAHTGPPFLIPYCPEIIDEQTAELTDEELTEYTNIIRWVCQTHIILWNQESDPVKRQCLIEDELAETWPGSLDVWNNVRIMVLDHTS